jgi:basic membrane lipoprotein Med (substrate-binding protein (PBP1-ABC) superfamily)
MDTVYKNMSFVLYSGILTVAIAIVMMTMILTGATITEGGAANVNKSIGSNKNMKMPGGNMTFGSSLDNARMHLTQAIMDLNEGNVEGAMMQLNMTEEGISMHEKEMMEMMKFMQQNVSSAELEVESKIS